MTSNSGASVVLVGRAGESVGLALRWRRSARWCASTVAGVMLNCVAEVNESLVRLPDEGDKGVVIDGLN